MAKMLFKTLLLIIGGMTLIPVLYAANDEPSYTTLRDIDKGTFNEYRYKLTEEYFDLKENFEIEGNIDTTSANKMLNLAEVSYSYLPDNLANKNLYNNLTTSLKRGIKYPENENNYTAIVDELQAYIEDIRIDSVKGSIEAFPGEGNAPLTVSFRGRVTDPSGSKLEDHNYVWWMDNAGKKTIIGSSKPSINYTFTEEGTFSVFLDVKSNHRNEEGFNDVLPFSSREYIKVKEKIASLIIKGNRTNLRQSDELKFNPDEASYGLLFDATSSTPTSGSKFTKTTWDFGNGIKKTYDGSPKVERIKYTREGRFNVTLELKTNELKTVKRKFVIDVHDPIATIVSSSKEGFLGDKFTFSARPTGNDKNLSYYWEIVNIDKDEIIFQKPGSLITYTFLEKGKFTVRLNVKEPSGENDIDTANIYINSRAPVAEFTHSIPQKNKPNRVLLDATRSYDLDFSDDGNLEYKWIIDGKKVELEDPNYDGSVGYHTFNSTKEHSVILEVTDPDEISGIKKGNVDIRSILSVEFFVFPRVTKIGSSVRLVSNSPEARFYEWDFGDGDSVGGRSDKVTHKYSKSGMYTVTLKVRDNDDNENKFSKIVYVGEDNKPYAYIDVKPGSNLDAPYEEGVCDDGKGAYILDRVSSITFSGDESINVDGRPQGLSYSWKLGREFFNSASFTKKFDDLGCIPLKLTVQGKDNLKSDSREIMIKVVNVLPTLSSLNVSVQDISSDPVVVEVSALGAIDRDGIIQSYLWYYYTDVDPEPQDFRGTLNPHTTFVLPKITGNYYFVVVMKDSNEARNSSEAITGSKYFITLTGDNINTPLIELSVDDSSVATSDEVRFSAVVKNILGQDITSKGEYSWDFDGDGFYDKQTKTADITHKFDNSGEFHAKLKVKHKGFSNTKSVTINVANRLVADFDYISIGDKYVFFNKSSGKIDSITWDMGDGEIIRGKSNITYDYTDKKPAHTVELKIGEGTKVKKTDKKVVRSIKNKLKLKDNSLILFSNPAIVNGQITLENKGEKIFIYPGLSSGAFKYYGIDYDIEKDSDLNGGKDDDHDNKNDTNYVSGDPIEVRLNDAKEQSVRILLIKADGEIFDSTDITIVKTYIKEIEIDPDSIKFEGISTSEKLKIEKIKSLVSALPQNERLKSMMYVQKLQEEWFDNTEKTRVILEFEGYLNTIENSSTEEIVNLLEALLVEKELEKDERSVMYNALKNLLPTSVNCEYSDEFSNCHEFLTSKLDEIRNSDDLDKNKLLGTEILKVVGDDNNHDMTVKQALDFKEILKSFVYGGVANIPEEEIPDDSKPADPSDDSEGVSFGGIIKTIGVWVGIIFAIIIGIIIAFYLYYKLTNKNHDIGFQDFIIDKTSSGDDILGDNVQSDGDILGSIDDKVEKPVEKKIEDKIQEKVNPTVIEDKPFKKEEAKPFKDNSRFNRQEKTNTNLNKKEDLDKITKIDDSSAPDWLKSSFIEKKDDKKEEKKDETKTIVDNKVNDISKDKDVVKEENVPSWLKGSLDDKDTDKTKKDTNDIPTPKKEEKKVENKKPEDKPIEKKVVEKKVVEEKVETPSAKKETPKEDENVPDWLKDTMDEEPKKKSPTKKPKEKTTEKKTPPKKEVDKKDKKGEDKDKSVELWDDGMDVPDWLKTDDKK